MNAIRRFVLATLIAAAGFLSPAGATSFSTDQSDVWSVPGENGWGFQLVQRNSGIFATMYVYDPTNIPIWYTATLEYAGNLVWTGDLYLTHGPWFGTVPFNSNAVTYRKVGTMTWTATSVAAGEMRYDVDGVTVVKNATRPLLRYDDFSGHFAGGIHQTTTGCLNPSFNGTGENFGIFNVAQNGQALSLGVFPTTGGSCTYSGALTQAGQMGSVTGTFACSNGETGTFQFFEMQVTLNSIATRFVANSSTMAGCQYTGYAVGMRATTF